MKFIFHKPKNEILKQYIAGYYLLDKQLNFPNRYLTFPNNFAILTFLPSATIEKIGEKIFINSSPKKSSLSLSYNYLRPWEINYKQPIEELTIYFKPFGINQFVTQIETVLKEESVEDFAVKEFSKLELTQLITAAQHQDPVPLIDAFLLSKLKPIADPTIENILTMLENDESIDEISTKLSLSRQYINRYFKKKIGKSPSDYRKIARFRNTLKNRKAHDTFTQLSYENLFFDQSHFNKDFKQLTALKPKHFFDQIDTDSNTVWFIL